MTIQKCRSCGSKALEPVLDLGKMPVANALLSAASGPPESTFPLAVLFCGACSLLQISETIPPDAIFCQDYPYFSSSSPHLVAHARRNVEELITRRRLGPDSFVVEIASNDGYLLRHVIERGIPALGVDPASGPAEAAKAAGVATVQAFFCREFGETLAASGRSADVIIANNVLAHVPDINDFVCGIRAALKPDGIAVFEFPYVVNMIDACEFDTIYHEHVFYFSLTALKHLFDRHGLFLNDAQRLSIHGGSIRLFVGQHAGESAELTELLVEEGRRGVDRVDYYRSFGARVESLRSWLRGMLECLKAEGSVIAAYGAAAKGATLLNFIKPAPGVLDYVVDRNPHKQGKFMPGHRLPIREPEVLLAERPDYTLLLSWNFAEEVIRDQRAYIEGGGRFIIPIPHPFILDRSSVASPIAAH